MVKPFSAMPGILSRREREFLQGVDRVIREAARAGGRAMAENTRVDTGLARSNYRATLGAPASGTIPPYAPGKDLGVGEQGNLLGVTNQHRSVTRVWTPTRGTPLFITNNVAYIGLLNFGGPNVSPGNMLRMGLQAAVASAKTRRRILR